MMNALGDIIQRCYRPTAKRRLAYFVDRASEDKDPTSAIEAIRNFPIVNIFETSLGQEENMSTMSTPATGDASTESSEVGETPRSEVTEFESESQIEVDVTSTRRLTAATVDNRTKAEMLEDERKLKRENQELRNMNNTHLRAAANPGGNSVRARGMKPTYHGTDLTNYIKIGALSKVMWVTVKMLPHNWHEWSVHPQSFCQKIMGEISVPKGVNAMDYYKTMATSMMHAKYRNLKGNFQTAVRLAYYSK